MVKKIEIWASRSKEIIRNKYSNGSVLLMKFEIKCPKYHLLLLNAMSKGAGWTQIKFMYSPKRRGRCKTSEIDLQA